MRGHEGPVRGIDFLGKPSADELDGVFAAETGQGALEHALEGLRGGRSEQRLLGFARQALEERFGAHRPRFRIEARRSQQAHRSMGTRVPRAPSRGMRRHARVDVGGIARVIAAIAAFEHIHIVREPLHAHPFRSASTIAPSRRALPGRTRPANAGAGAKSIARARPIPSPVYQPHWSATVTTADPASREQAARARSKAFPTRGGIARCVLHERTRCKNNPPFRLEFNAPTDRL